MINLVVSKNYNIPTVSVKKASLSLFDDKEYILDENVMNYL